MSISNILSDFPTQFGSGLLFLQVTEAQSKLTKVKNNNNMANLAFVIWN